MAVFEWRSPMPVSADELYAWHLSPGAFERITPPWQRMRVIEQSGGVADGARVVFEVKMGPVWRRWTADHRDVVEGRQFVDVQVKGPFAAWVHTHRFVPIADGSSELIDHIEYRLPGGAAGTLGEGQARRTLERMFTFRHLRTRNDLERHARWRERPRLKVAVTGAGGLVGEHLAPYLTTAGHEVVRLVRRPATGPGEVTWDPRSGSLDPAALEGVDAIVHLAGETISGLWTAGKREAIMSSRRDGAATLAAAVAAMKRPPGVVVSASAVGAYGLHGDEEITEEDGYGTGFLADVCREWEAASRPMADMGARLVTYRSGLVLSGAGGLLTRMTPTARAGLGTQFGDGAQWWSWIDLDDTLAALEWMLHDEGLSGPVNVTSPAPVTNREFTKLLGAVLRRPAPLTAPRAVLEKTLGDFAREMLLASQRVLPARLQARGFEFSFAQLAPALRFELGRS